MTAFAYEPSMLSTMHPLLRRALVLSVILLFIYLAGGAVRAQIGIDFDIESVRDYVLGLGPLAPLLFIFIVAGRALLWLPSQVVLIVAGLCFGTVLGSIVGGAGLMLSGLFVFGTARYAGRDVIERRLGARARSLLGVANRRSGGAALALACGYPISPLSPLHAAAGWTPMTVPNFIIAAYLGGMLRASIFAYFGDALLEASPQALAAPVIVMLAALIVPMLFPSGRKWLRDIFRPAPVTTPLRATSPSDSATGE